jgi:uncharacterized protein (TIGR02266 family)
MPLKLERREIQGICHCGRYGYAGVEGPGDVRGAMRERRTSGEFVLERRGTPRVPLRVAVTCYTAGTCFSGTTANLTVRGLSLETETPVLPDAEVEVVIELPDGEKPVKVSGRVARLARRKDDPLGFGVEFDNLEESARGRIAALVDDAFADLR